MSRKFTIVKNRGQIIRAFHKCIPRTEMSLETSENNNVQNFHDRENKGQKFFPGFGRGVCRPG